MKFCDKVKEARTNAGLTQQDFADAIGVSLRTVTNYESGMSYPKKRELYNTIATVLNVDLNYLLTEGETNNVFANEFLELSGAQQAADLVAQARTMFAGGSLSEEDARTFVDEIQGLYLEAKARAKKQDQNKK